MNDEQSYFLNCKICNKKCPLSEVAFNIASKMLFLCGNCVGLKRMEINGETFVVNNEFLKCLGLKRKRWRHYNYKAAKQYMSDKNVKSKNEFSKWCKEGNRPRFIPRNPERDYKKKGEWINWADFLSSNRFNPSRHIVDYETAKAFIHNHNFCNIDEYLEFWMVNKQIQLLLPKYPDAHYKKLGKWCGWKQFLGYGTIENT